jgi:hypothetical protein
MHSQKIIATVYDADNNEVSLRGDGLGGLVWCPDGCDIYDERAEHVAHVEPEDATGNQTADLVELARSRYGTYGWGLVIECDPREDD